MQELLGEITETSSDELEQVLLLGQAFIEKIQMGNVIMDMIMLQADIGMNVITNRASIFGIIRSTEVSQLVSKFRVST